MAKPLRRARLYVNSPVHLSVVIDADKILADFIAAEGVRSVIWTVYGQTFVHGQTLDRDWTEPGQRLDFLCNVCLTTR